MTSRVQLDFFVPPPERRQCVRERLAQQRAPMFEWRHDFAESAFDAATGERRPLRRIFNPVAKERPASVRRIHAAAHNAGAHAAATTASSARPATAPVWEAAASGSADRRSAWKQSGFRFTENYFRKSAHLPVSQLRPHTSASASGLLRSARRGGVYVPYLHDTILFCEPLPRSMELHRGGPGGGGGGDGAAAAADQLPPVKRPSSTASVVLAVTCNAAESRARELQASVDAKRAALLGCSKPANCLYAAGVKSFTCDDDVSTGATAQGETCCDVVGPSIAAKQRALAMAEGVYTDLILNRGKAWSATATAAAAKTELPTGELAYSLRPSYVQSRLRRTAGRRSSSSQNLGTAGIVSDRYSASLDEVMSGTTQHTTAVTSPMMACVSAPHIRGHRGNGVSGPPSERAITRSPGNDSIAGTVPLAATEVALADTITFVRRSGSTAYHSSTTAAPPPALSPMELRHDVEDTGKTRSPDGVRGLATSKTSPTAAAAGLRAGHRQGLQPTSSSLPSHGNTQRQSDSNPLLHQLYRTSNSTDSPTYLRTYGDAGGSTIAGGSNYGSGEGGGQRHRRDGRDARDSPHQSPLRPRGGGDVSNDAQQEHHRYQRPFTAYRLPTESKETRVYAVQLRGLCNADPSLLKRAEPLRRGIPVMLPPDWQPNC
ncbi:conserved hypothetical protein [Leishmania major strain Friedlin]|uniref:Uncharacterized protein n=1 Tax=Leishmania major TaxID=5664 RepID=E9AC45_LEIMA|nr:conserved hypothetical protein [Leishmania major strain Friedlin]CAG9567119.1 hypothetical_protein_-_conserved [Leishmania major strain Friedlin]CBZ11859.1 conserved hypothetical protein [Leishmania major strain Friedlin]|eukprot:XP_003721576.1 conserved hypothetical protein [Leishmania major strain Friedlin]